MNKYLSLLFVVLYFCQAAATATAQAPANVSGGSLLVDTKCSKCHTLKRVFITQKTGEEWRATVQKMRDKNPAWIKPEDAEQIIREIKTFWPDRIQALTAEKKEFEDTRFLFVDRCAFCHNLNRILIKSKTDEEWVETVENMRSQAPDYISKEDAVRIAHYLSERADLLKEDMGGKLFVTKCLICHPGDQILLETHDKAGWTKIIEKMKELAKDAQVVRLSHEECQMITDLLVKTQGPKADDKSR